MTALFFTHHAVERFVKRHAPEMTLTEARAFLEENGPQAKRLRERTILGQVQMVLDSPRCILVIKHDRRERRPICVTVLPEAEPFEPPVDEVDDEPCVTPAVAAAMPVRPVRLRDLPPRGPAKKPPQPPCIPKDQAKLAALVELQRIALEREVSRTQRHLDMTNEEIRKYKSIVLVALRTLVRSAGGIHSPAEALGVLEAVQQVDPGLLTARALGAGARDGES